MPSLDDLRKRIKSVKSTQKITKAMKMVAAAKLTELLKQKQYSPMSVAEQVISVFCGVRGYLDDVDLKDISEFENKILTKCNSENPEILDTIKKTGKLEEETEKTLIKLIEELKKSFKS